MTLKFNVFFILVLCLTTVPCRKMSLLYLSGPGILTWTSTSINLFTCHSNVSWTEWTPHTLYLDSRISHSDSHKDLGDSEDLCWDKHYKAITVHAYKVLGLACCIILSYHLTSTMVRLYASLVRSQLLYCTQIWHPHQMKDILNIERFQCRVTKYIATK